MSVDNFKATSGQYFAFWWGPALIKKIKYLDVPYTVAFADNVAERSVGDTVSMQYFQARDYQIQLLFEACL